MSPLPNRPDRARPRCATRMSPNQIDSRSRSAGSPALPTAMTTRPQLASSPATAVLTSGELAIDSAMRLAERADFAPVTRDLDLLARALAVAHHLQRQRLQHAGSSAAAEGAEARDPWRRRSRRAALCRRAGGEQQQRVAGRGVAVDRDRVEGLGRRRRQQRLQHGRGDRRVGRHEGQHRRHVGRDHAGALGDAVDGHVDVAELDGRGRVFRDRCRWS